MNAHYTSTCETLIPLNTPLPKTPMEGIFGPQYIVNFEGDRSLRFVANYTFTSKMTNDTLATLNFRDPTPESSIYRRLRTAGDKYEIVLAAPM